MRTITIRQPDDMHLHLRDGVYLETTVPATAAQCARAVVMPNLVPPVTTTQQALNYYEQIKALVPADKSFEPMMTLYLTDNTTSDEIKIASKHPKMIGAKLYPAGATTNSDSGVTNIKALYPVLETMQACGFPLLIHGETTDATVDVFDRERVFIEQTLIPIVKQFPTLRIVLEHITTADAVHFVLAQDEHIAATITVHHLHINRNDILVGGIQPHHYCLPIAKREQHRLALVEAATSGHAKFFLGTDSAPHTLENKHSACGCAGIYTAPVAIELATQCFAEHDALDALEAFTSINGANFYNLPHNEHTLTLIEQPWQVPETIRFGDSQVIPFFAGKEITWQIKR